MLAATRLIIKVLWEKLVDRRVHFNIILKFSFGTIGTGYNMNCECFVVAVDAFIRSEKKTRPPFAATWESFLIAARRLHQLDALNVCVHKILWESETQIFIRICILLNLFFGAFLTCRCYGTTLSR